MTRPYDENFQNVLCLEIHWVGKLKFLKCSMPGDKSDGDFFLMLHALRYNWWGKETFEMFHPWGYIGWENEILKMLRNILGG